MTPARAGKQNGSGPPDPCDQPNPVPTARRSSIVVQMDCDRNLRACFTCCRHCGTPQDGHLVGDEDRPSMAHTRNNAGTIAQFACRHHGHRILEQLAPVFYSADNAELELNDFSLEGGGPFPPHSRHQNGLNVDINYNYIDDEKKGSLLRLMDGISSVEFIRVQPIVYDYLFADDPPSSPWQKSGGQGEDYIDM